MKKELADSLRYMQANPTTGMPHNRQVVSTQVETIFMLDSLIDEIKSLEKTINQANKQSEGLEKSNLKLQLVMLALTVVTTIVAIFPFLKFVVSLISPYFAILINNLTSFNISAALITSFVSVLLSIAAGLIGFNESRKKLGLQFSEKIGVRDSLKVVVLNQKGEIKKEYRNK